MADYERLLAESAEEEQLSPPAKKFKPLNEFYREAVVFPGEDLLKKKKSRHIIANQTTTALDNRFTKSLFSLRRALDEYLLDHLDEPSVQRLNIDDVAFTMLDMWMKNVSSSSSTSSDPRQMCLEAISVHLHRQPDT